MKLFEEYKDGEWVVLFNEKHPWHLMQFQAYKSKWTHGAFRLKYGNRELIVDISEVHPIAEINKLLKERDEKLNRDNQSGFNPGVAGIVGFDEDGTYHIQD